MHARRQAKAERSPWKLLLWAALATILFGLAEFGEPAEDALRVARNRLHMHPASGDIVLVAIDDKALRQVGDWPWRRSEQARLVRAVSSANPDRVFLDIVYDHRTSPFDDAALADALAAAPGAVLASRYRTGAYRSAVNGGSGRPLQLFAQHGQLASVSVEYNYQNAVWTLPYAVASDPQPQPGFAAELARARGPVGKDFRVDYSLDLFSVPRVGAADVLAGRGAERLAGKTVVIGTMSEEIGDQYYIPGLGKMGGAIVHIAGAETLKRGAPLDLGWATGLALAFAFAAASLHSALHRRQGLVLAAAAAVLLLGPAPLEARNIFIDVLPGLFLLLVLALARLWRRYRMGSQTNPLSGLPNLNALRLNRAGRDHALIVARVLNYSEAVAALPSDSERQLIEQIIGRLALGSQERTIYHGDGGIFAWFDESRKNFAHQMDALHALFRNPVRVAGLSIDLSLSFGIEIGSSRSLANRLGSALVAAGDAAHDGLKWKYYDPESFENASWKLSMLSQLDSAIDKGEVWIAFQPQLDLATRRIVGAEALARWTHPEKGPIAASEFIAAAEQSDRIAKLTDFVLEKSVAAAAALNKRGHDFDVAVNLSARLLTDKQFVIRVAALLARHGLEPRHLTLELTETSELAESGEALDMLVRLRELGLGISIDDYGTGLSTLDYLKKIPATEIKIDQSFVKALCDNRSDRLMVQSTVELAHSLGRRVVAEGVEHRETLESLIAMGCDLAQGFIVGRPMNLESLLKRVSADRRRRVA